MAGKRDFTAEAANAFKSKYQEWGIDAPSLHVVLGSGYGQGLETFLAGAKGEWGWKELGSLPFAEVPGLTSATAPDHKGAYRYFQNKKTKRVLTLQMGRLHGYEGLAPEDVVRTVVAACLAGTKTFILTNASGALHRKYPVGSAILITDHVNLTGKNPLSGPKFIDMSQTYDKDLRARLRPHLEAAGVEVNEGTYLGLSGPSFETPMEVKLFGQWGLDAVGMSTVWEAIALTHAGARMAGIALLSNLGSGLSPVPLSHEDVLRESHAAATKILRAVFTFAEGENRE